MRHIVIDIDHPNDVGEQALEAMHSVVQSGDHIHFFHQIYHAGLGDRTGEDQMLGEARDLLYAARVEQLERLTEEFAPNPATATVSWTEHGWQSLLQHAALVQAQLVVAKSRRGPRWRPLSGPHDDWQLIRHSKVPLLLWRPECTRRYQSILAAIDPLHVDDKPAELDRRILAHAAEFARQHGARLDVLNVVPVSGAGASGLSVPALPPVAQSRSLAAHEARVATLVNELEIDVHSSMVVAGVPANEIVRTAATQNTDLVVMGAVARSTIRNLLIGNTAEKVLDRLNADTLVIKPANVVTQRKSTVKASLGAEDMSSSTQPDVAPE